VKGRVLVVDDDPQILDAVGMRLAHLGLQVTGSRNAHETLAAVAERPFDAALIDLWMKPTDGITLMEQVHALQPRLPVLIMSGQGTIETAVSAVQRGAFDFLTKPFVRDELPRKLGRALSERRWARDRERLRVVGETLASSGVMERILDAVAQAAVETTEAEHCVVFLREKGQLSPMASAGTPPASWQSLEHAARAAMEKGAPTILTGDDERVALAAPLFVEGGRAGALVIEAPARVEPTEDDLDRLALFSSQAAVAIKNTHELSRLRSGALAALGRIATEVAHELKNPLGGLKLYARHLEQRLTRTGDLEGLDIARKIGQAIDHLSELVADITTFGRPIELRRAATDVNGLLNECLALAQDRIVERQAEVVRAYDPGCPPALLDGRALRKVLLNLIVNGLEAIEGKGTLYVRTAVQAGVIEVTIEDTGPGMTEETLSRMFDLFFTTKPNGTGLGMAIARSVVTQHGGELSVDSAPGKGTRVRVRLPAHTGTET
jgi:signal transduction histidine kinase/FixJ family two-component response regulator